MSGHSHYKSIKHQKGLADAKRGKIFSKMARLISIAAREGGKDPDANPKLRGAIEQAKKLQMPSENIERAIKRGAGELEGAQLEKVTFEALGPGGIAIMIEGITDNKKRGMSEIKQILSQHGGKLVGEGSIKWQFEQKGVIGLRNANSHENQGLSQMKNEELELALIEAGAEDIVRGEDSIEIRTKPDELGKVKSALEQKGLSVEPASLDWVAKEVVDPGLEDRQKLEKLFEALDENDAVQEIYSNLRC